MRVPSLDSLGGLRIQCRHELCCWLKMWLRSNVAVAVAMDGSCSSDSTPSLGTSICHGCSLKKQKKKRKKKIVLKGAESGAGIPFHRHFIKPKKERWFIIFDILIGRAPEFDS